MTYLDWFLEHNKKHHAIVEKLIAKGNKKEAIIDYFVYENMVKMEPSFCLLYAHNEKCHKRDYLNCYLCACPHFRFNDEGLKIEEGINYKSECFIHSKKSGYFVYEKVSHLDCSACSVPHTKAYIRKHFDVDWKKIMQKCFVTSPKAKHLR